jgi:hypothetical protein
MRMTSPFATNASDFPSGEKVGRIALSVPGSGAAAPTSVRIIHNALALSRAVAHTTRLPSGETSSERIFCERGSLPIERGALPGSAMDQNRGSALSLAG